MSTDKTEPPIGRIVGVGALSIVILVGLQFVLNSYFITMYETEQHRVVLDRPSELLQRKRAEDEEHLRAGRPMPIDQAVSAIARGERPAAIEPRPSTELDAMRGWGIMPRVFNPTPVAGPGQATPAPVFDPAAPAVPAVPGATAPAVAPPAAVPPNGAAPAALPTVAAPPAALPAVAAPPAAAPLAAPAVAPHAPVAPAPPVGIAAPVAPALRRPAAAPVVAPGQGSRPAAPPRPAGAVAPAGAP